MISHKFSLFKKTKRENFSRKILPFKANNRNFLNYDSVIIIYFCFLFSTVFAGAALQTADEFYKIRSSNCTGIRPDPVFTEKASLYYLEAMNNPSDEERAAVGYLKTLYFKGAYIITDREELRKIFSIGVSLGEKMKIRYPDSLDLIYWTGIMWGKWVQVHSVFKAASEGVPQRLKKAMEHILSADPLYEKGLAYVFYAKLHLATPKIPVILEWPSKKTAISCLEQALVMYPENTTALMYYAEALNADGQKKEAKKILYNLAVRKPRTDFYIEDLIYIEQARKISGKYR